MEEFDDRTVGKIVTNKDLLEEKLNIELEIKGNIVNTHGEELDTYIADKVIEAIDNNIPIKTALTLKNTDIDLFIMNLKEIVKHKDKKSKNLKRVRGRLIGTNGRALENLKRISSCCITLKDNIITIVGPSDRIKPLVTAIQKLARGSDHGKVYAYLENQEKLPENLKLKEEDLEKEEK